MNESSKRKGKYQGTVCRVRFCEEKPREEWAERNKYMNEEQTNIDDLSKCGFDSWQRLFAKKQYSVLVS